MEELCTGCLCAGRKMYLIDETGFSDLYKQILNEIPISDQTSVPIRICWECVACLKRFARFKAQVKQCYTDMMWHIPPPSLQPRLTTHPLPVISYPECFHPLKEEPAVKTEVDWPQTFAHEISFIDDDGGDGDKFDDGYTAINDDDDEKEITKKSKKKTKTKEKKQKVKKTKMKSKISKIKPIKSNKTVLQEDNRTEDHIELEKGKEETEKVVEENNEEKRLEKIDNDAKVAPIGDRPQCVECGKMFSSRKTYRYHLNVLHKGQNRYPCPRCGKVYQWKSNLGRHLRTHKAVDAGELHCVLCDKSFASVATYRQHLRISRRHVAESDFSFTCNECGKKFVNKTRLRDHIDWEHLNNIKFRCQLCNKAYKCHTSLYVHLQNVHRNKEKKDNLCHVCGKSYQNPAKLKYHITALHTGETPYQCAQCSAAFGWYSSLYRHVREVHYKMKVQPKKSKKIKKIESEPSTYINYPT